MLKNMETSGTSPVRRLFMLFIGSDRKVRFYNELRFSRKSYSRISPYQTEADYRQMLVAGLYNRMLNQRLFELTKQEDPPYLEPVGAEVDLCGRKTPFRSGRR